MISPTQLLDVLLHLDNYLAAIIQTFGIWTYLILFIVIFIETGLVVTPFLPGDSLLFAAGTFAALGHLNVLGIIILLSLAAILGDSVNYAIGKFVGPKVFQQDTRFIRKEYLDRTHLFFEKYGRKTIFLARFVPIIRTFAPFVAGIGEMSYPHFITYNVLGAITWVTLMTLAGFWFGNIPVVRDHFSLAILAVIGISLIPAIIETIKARLSSPKIETI